MYTTLHMNIFIYIRDSCTNCTQCHPLLSYFHKYPLLLATSTGDNLYRLCPTLAWAVPVFYTNLVNCGALHICSSFSLGPNGEAICLHSERFALSLPVSAFVLEDNECFFFLFRDCWSMLWNCLQLNLSLTEL